MSFFSGLSLSVAQSAPPLPVPSRFGSRAQQRAVAAYSVLPKKGHVLGSSGKLPVRASPPYIQTLSEWDTDSVLAALDEHARGEFSTSGLLWQWMARDDRMQTVLRVRRAGLTTLPFSLVPASKDKKTASPQEQRAVDLFQDEWARCVPETFIRGMVDRAVGMGVAVARVSWVTGKYGFWWPRLAVWPAEAVRWDDTRRCYLARSRSGQESRVTPGSGWILWEPDGARGFQLAAVLCLALPCLITSFDWRDWVNYNEAFGRPVRKATVPKGATTTVKNTFLANLRALGRTTSSILCEKNLDGSGFDFEFVTPQGDVTATFEKSIDRSDKAKATVILGQTLTTDVQSAVGMAPTDVRQNVKGQVIEADAESLATCLREQLLQPMALYNLGASALAPWPTWDTKPPADKAKDAAADKSVGDAVTSLSAGFRGSGYRLDKRTYLEQKGIPMLEGEELGQPGQEPTTTYQAGDRVKVRDGYEHDEMTKGATGTIRQVSSAALAVEFDGMPELHKWYTAEELEDKAPLPTAPAVPATPSPSAPTPP